MKYPVFFLTHEDLLIGYFPYMSISIRWKDAEDGITWIKPTISLIRYAKGV
jgi:hypothetical protein